MIALATLVLSIWSISHANAELEQCFADIEQPYRYFSSRTSYYTSRASPGIIPEECTPTYIWALLRHGTRYPGLKLINSVHKLYDLRDEIVQNHEEGRGKLCQRDVENLEKWTTNLTADLEYELTAQGIDDETLLAEVVKIKFPELLESLETDSFLFQSSEAKRTQDSAIVFTNKLLGTDYTTIDGNNITINEELLHVNKHCPRYKEDVENNATTYKEMKLFKNSDTMKILVLDLSARLGYKQVLPYDSVELMYDICSYETAWYLNSRPAFCAVFLPEELKVFEYLYDMSDYHVKGYGTRLADKMGCVVVRDMMMSLDQASKNPESTRKGTFYFTHSETIIPTTVKLGLNRDDQPLSHDNYATMKETRKWKLALFDSFAANIITVLYKCPGENGTRDIVSIYQNERKVVLPNCASDSCTLEELKQNFNDVFDEDKCNLNFCHVSAESLKSSSVYSLFSSSSGFVIVCLIAIKLVYYFSNVLHY